MAMPVKYQSFCFPLQLTPQEGHQRTKENQDFDLTSPERKAVLRGEEGGGMTP